MGPLESEAAYSYDGLPPSARALALALAIQRRGAGPSPARTTSESVVITE